MAVKRSNLDGTTLEVNVTHLNLETIPETGAAIALDALEAEFSDLAAAIAERLLPEEQFTLGLNAEQSQFVRFNHARVRQTGGIVDCQVGLTLMANQRTASWRFPLTGNWDTDWAIAADALADLRADLPHLPIDPYQVLPSGDATSRDVHHGCLLDPNAVVDAVLPEVDGLDFTGIYAGGRMLQAYADSVGQRHWFATDSFSLDYSLFTADGQAVKGTLAGSEWDAAAYAAKLADSKQQLERLALTPKPIPKGGYRVYLAPAALADIVAMFSWGGVSEASLQQGESALGALQRGDRTLSSQFTLRENFASGLVPRFNHLGEIAPMELTIIDQGKLVNTLVNSRTAKEYGKTANGANSAESLRSPEVCPGSLPAADVLTALETGLYLSNLHYLNWSDRPTGRITGMTRYACFWVEQGEIVAPIENLRFDESLYRCLGDNLIALTQQIEFIATVDTYERRRLGGMWVPGALVEDFTFTL
ncbi:metallopeptidase TldD-related protein [Thermoleptolyngbya sichuanensis XZ-Cy5]|uniref:TldD/PmbA family protein n=1 Tax=Thermoleptolyngbya sichuanensis TaxID=2885951 RepID=UPI00240D1B77|nr:metallopeptidase TldD-related protein [Thermoleptolyngbya sichuanensis]MDG2615600.1 metallopeptidase TldD-related protein [Thermoleptolyngbya sichuanensis XZ-Cy5]